jgi:hypothetical protein
MTQQEESHYQLAALKALNEGFEGLAAAIWELYNKELKKGNK